MTSNGQIYVKLEYQNKERRENEAKKKYLEQIKAQYFLNLMKDKNFQMQDIPNTNEIFIKKSMNCDIVVKLLKVKEEEKILKVERLKHTNTGKQT